MIIFEISEIFAVLHWDEPLPSFPRGSERGKERLQLRAALSGVTAGAPRSTATRNKSAAGFVHPPAAAEV